MFPPMRWTRCVQACQYFSDPDVASSHPWDAEEQCIAVYTTSHKVIFWINPFVWHKIQTEKGLACICACVYVNLVLSGRVSQRGQCLMRPLISGLPQRYPLRELNGSITSLETGKPKRLFISGVARRPIQRPSPAQRPTVRKWGD